jgi:hypothetical protein
MIYHWNGLKYFSAPINSLHPKAFVNKHSAIKSLNPNARKKYQVHFTWKNTKHGKPFDQCSQYYNCCSFGR